MLMLNVKNALLPVNFFFWEKTCFVQNKSGSDMQVPRTQRKALRPPAGSNWPVADTHPILLFIIIENVQTIQ